MERKKTWATLCSIFTRYIGDVQTETPFHHVPGSKFNYFDPTASRALIRTLSERTEALRERDRDLAAGEYPAVVGPRRSDDDFLRTLFRRDLQVRTAERDVRESCSARV